MLTVRNADRTETPLRAVHTAVFTADRHSSSSRVGGHSCYPVIDPVGPISLGGWVPAPNRYRSLVTHWQFCGGASWSSNFTRHASAPSGNSFNSALASRHRG